MLELNAHFFKTWREYWGTEMGGDRREAEERNRELEALVKDNIFKTGQRSPKDVLAEVVEWKYGGMGCGDGEVSKRGVSAQK